MTADQIARVVLAATFWPFLASFLWGRYHAWSRRRLAAMSAVLAVNTAALVGYLVTVALLEHRWSWWFTLTVVTVAATMIWGRADLRRLDAWMLMRRAPARPPLDSHEPTAEIVGQPRRSGHRRARVLIVGGGVGGLTLAALLGQRQFEVTVLERAEAYDDVGYVLTLWAIGSRILPRLGLWGRFAEVSSPVERYVVRDQNARPIHSAPLGRWLADYGTPRTLSRAQLLALLRGVLAPDTVHTGATVDDLELDGARVRAHVIGQGWEECDLLVGADGIHSGIRTLLFGPISLRALDWDLVWWWANPGLVPSCEIHEYWCPGKLIGLYPAPERTACALVVPHTGPGATAGNRARLAEVARDIPAIGHALADSLTTATTASVQRLADSDLSTWGRDRAVLLGDAAAGFLPTAGIGASMAMESAAALADELIDADTTDLAQVVRRYQRRRRARVDAAQHDSRALARIMFLNNHTVATARSQLVRAIPDRVIADQLRRLHHQRHGGDRLMRY